MRETKSAGSTDTIVTINTSDMLYNQPDFNQNSKKIYIAASKKYFVPIDTSTCRNWLDFTTLLFTNNRLNIPITQCISYVYTVNSKDGTQLIVDQLDDLKEKAFYYIPSA